VLDDFSDDSLSAHESELDRMKGFYEDHKEIFKLIDKREEMWVKMLNFEVCFIFVVLHSVTLSILGIQAIKVLKQDMMDVIV